MKHASELEEKKFIKAGRSIGHKRDRLALAASFQIAYHTSQIVWSQLAWIRPNKMLKISAVNYLVNMKMELTWWKGQNISIYGIQLHSIQYLINIRGRGCDEVKFY